MANSVKMSDLLVGALLGAITVLPIMALMFFAEQFAALPFVPFDLFDLISRAIPGNVLTLVIDNMIRLILILQLGEISYTAKILEQLIAIFTVFVLGVLYGVVLAYVLVSRTWSKAWIGFTGGFILFLFVLGVELIRGLFTNPWLGVPWLALLMIGWGMLLTNWLGSEVRLSESPAGGESFRAYRRQLLVKIAGVSAALALGAWGWGWMLQQQRLESGADQPLPEGKPGGPTGSPPTVDQRIEPAPGTRSEVTASDDFYRVDINLRPPSLSESSWRLNIRGLFDNARSLSLSDLMALPAVKQPYTLSCISNPIGGDLIGNAYWTGVRTVDLLKELGLRAEAREFYVEAVDGFAESVSMADMLDPKTLLAYAMGDKTLSVEHGFPLRILIPNRYGMKQPKWITSIEAIDHSAVGYWVQRGWSLEARPQVLTIIDKASIDKDHAVGGLIPIGGVAWAGDRGIQTVEVQVDNGPWEPASLRVPPLGPLTWVQWRYDWKSTPGRHTFTLRGTDGAGRPQTGQTAPPYPDGATGYHSITATI